MNMFAISHNLPGWLKSTRTRKVLLAFKVCLLVVLLVAGCAMLAVLVGLLVSGAPLTTRLWTFASVIGFIALVSESLWSALRQWNQMKRVGAP